MSDFGAVLDGWAWDESCQQAADTLARERYEKSCEALHWALMSMPEELFEHLLSECSVKRQDVEAFHPYRSSKQQMIEFPQEDSRPAPF